MSSKRGAKKGWDIRTMGGGSDYFEGGVLESSIFTLYWSIKYKKALAQCEISFAPTKVINKAGL
jgi:hypothetical protein